MNQMGIDDLINSFNQTVLNLAIQSDLAEESNAQSDSKLTNQKYKDSTWYDNECREKKKEGSKIQSV